MYYYERDFLQKTMLMLNESYNYVGLENKVDYFFISEGINGKIIKNVQFTRLEDEDNLWNLAFGDYNTGNVDDKVVSNNYDIVKVFNTIAKIVYEYSNEFPTRDIHIEPVDGKRKKLYNHIFRRNYEAINLIFDIIGTIGEEKEDYSPDVFFDEFTLKRKFVQ